MSIESDNVLSAIRRGEDSLPRLRAATGLEYAKLHVVLHELEFEWRSIQRNETSDGFDRYLPMPTERTRPALQPALTIPPKSLYQTNAGDAARQMALLQRDAPYCVQCRGLCCPHGTDRTGKTRWRCKPCGVTFAGSGEATDLNRLAPEKRQAAITAFNEAKSVRRVASEIGIAKGTAEKIRSEENIEALCPCGEDAKHKGWCSYRFQNSPARQATLEKMNMARVDPHEEAEKEIAAMVERGRIPEPQHGAATAPRDFKVFNNVCGCGFAANHRGRCKDGQRKYARRDDDAQKSRENITETITSNGHNVDNARNADIAGNHDSIETPKQAMAIVRDIIPEKYQTAIMRTEIRPAWSPCFEKEVGDPEGGIGLTLFYLISLLHHNMEPHEKEAVWTLVQHLKRIEAYVEQEKR